MLSIVKEFISKNKIIEADNYIVCATSGGADSVVLLTMLYKLGYKVVLAHVNHHKRIESEAEQKAMESLANSLNIPFELLSYYDDHLDNFQDKAHNARYTFFKSVADKYKTKYIATAHHLDDQLETILMKIIAGSNLYGYGGISIKQNIDSYILIRPLLCLDKSQIYSYANINNLTYFEDNSNQSDDYFRNRLRHHIIPELKKEAPTILKKAQEYSTQVKEAFSFIRNQSIKYLDLLNNTIEVKTFTPLDIALQKDIICLLLERNNINKNNDIINSCLDLIHNNTNKEISLKNNSIFSISYGIAKITRKKMIAGFNEILNLDTEAFILGKYHFYFSKKIPQNNANYIKLCYNGLKLPLLIRNRTDGDFINMSYGKKKVSRVLIDAKIDKISRDNTPLIFDNEKNLLWIYNLAKSIDVESQKNNFDIFLVCEEKSNE